MFATGPKFEANNLNMKNQRDTFVWKSSRPIRNSGGKKKKKTFAVQCIICMEITNRSTWCVAALIRLNNSESLFFSHLTDDIVKGETLASER